MPASLSEQENAGLPAAMLPRGLGGGCGGGAAAPPSPPFRFSTPRQLIDWRALHALDLAALVRDTDIDALEGVLDIVAHGDMEGEDARHLTPANAARAFRVAQLAVDYLLHVQDRLAADVCTAKVVTHTGGSALGGRFCPGGACVQQCNSRAECNATGRGSPAAPPPPQGELAKLQRREQLLGLKVKELREELAGSRKEVRHLKKAAKTLEVRGCSGVRRPFERGSALLVLLSCPCSLFPSQVPSHSRPVILGLHRCNPQTLALARQAAPQTQPQEPWVVERVVEVPDAATARRAERLEAELAQLAEERLELQRWVEGVCKGAWKAGEL